jgi:hypothetical protein
MRSIRFLLCLFALLAAGCGGGGDDESGSGGGQTTTPAGAGYGTAAPGPGETLTRFVRAAQEGEADAMWNLLTQPTQASIGPTLEDFRRTTATELQEGLGTLAKNAKVIVSRELPNDWGVAAIAGERDAEGDREYYAYGVGLAREAGQWKIELGGVVISGLKPDPLEETDALPQIKANVGAGGDLQQILVFLDGKPLAFARGGDSPFAASVSAKPPAKLAPGRHEVVVFASTDLTASAVAWTFSVQG